MTRRVTHQSVCISKAVRERWCKVKLYLFRGLVFHISIFYFVSLFQTQLNWETNGFKISGIFFSEDEVGVSPCAVQPVFVRLLQQDAV